MIPSEIWKYILLNLNHKNICLFSKTCKYFRNLCRKENIFEERKWLGFPRKEEHCKVHDMREFAGHNEYVSDDISLYDLLLTAKYNGYGFDRIQNLILDELYGTNTDLVRGDLIILHDDGCTNMGLYLFDGIKIIELQYNSVSSLPKDFTVINNNIPIDYWRHITKWKKNNNFIDYIIVNRGIRGRHKIWFDHICVQKQCLDNINYETEINMITTNFIYNDINYIIEAASDDFDILTNINKFRIILNASNKLLLVKINDTKINIYNHLTYLPLNAINLYLSIDDNEKYGKYEKI
jgi:hypothetical protein